MVICPKCGLQNQDGLMFCTNCRSVLPKQVANQQMPRSDQQQYYPYQYAQPPRPDRTKSIVTIVVAALIILIVGSVLAVALILPSTTVTIDDWDADGFLGTVIFTVNITNNGEDIVSRTITCSVTFDDGDTFTQSQKVSLDAFESRTIVILVIVPNPSHFSEISGEDWSDVDCRLS